MLKLIKTTTLLTLIAFASIFVNTALANNLNQEINGYIDVFKGNNFAKQRKVIDKLAWAGISDSRLYDLMAAKLDSTMSSDDKIGVDQASWFAKGLARSGNKKYIADLERVSKQAAHKKTRKYAANSIATLNKYSEWNPIIAKGLSNTASGKLEQARVKNMLNSSNYGLMTIGAKRVYYGHNSEKPLAALASKRLMEEYQSVAGNKDGIDAVAWLIKALAETGDSSHKSTLVKIAETAKDKKVKKYAKKYAAYL